MTLIQTSTLSMIFLPPPPHPLTFYFDFRTIFVFREVFYAYKNQYCKGQFIKTAFFIQLCASSFCYIYNHIKHSSRGFSQEILSNVIFKLKSIVTGYKRSVKGCGSQRSDAKCLYPVIFSKESTCLS